MSYNLGPLPGTDLAAAADVIVSETPLRTIPLLPARGISSELLGSTLALMRELPVEKGPRSWRISSRPQILSRRIWDLAERDTDLIEELWGPCEKLQFAVLGPWSLTASVEMDNGHRMLRDTGALRDLFEIFEESLAQHAEDLSRRFGAEVDVLIHEPVLPALRAGKIPGASKFDRIAAVPENEIGEKLHPTFETLRANGLHTVRLFLPGTPLFEAGRISEADELIVELRRITGTALLDQLGYTVSAGHRVALGAAQAGDTVDEDRARPRQLATTIAALWDEVALPRESLAGVTVLPAAPLEGTSLLQAARCLEFARVCTEMLLRDAGDL